MSLALVVLLGAAVLLLAAGALIAFVAFGGYGPRDSELQALTAKEEATVLAAAEALLPAGGHIELGGAEAGLLRYTDRYVARLPVETRRLVRLLLAFVEHAPWLLGPRCARLTRLRPDERVVVFRRMSASRSYLFRTAFTSLRTILAIGYLANNNVAAAIGYLAASEQPNQREAEALSELPVSGAVDVEVAASDVERAHAQEGGVLESGERPVIASEQRGGVVRASEVA